MSAKDKVLIFVAELEILMNYVLLLYLHLVSKDSVVTPNLTRSKLFRSLNYLD